MVAMRGERIVIVVVVVVVVVDLWWSIFLRISSVFESTEELGSWGSLHVRVLGACEFSERARGRERGFVVAVLF